MVRELGAVLLAAGCALIGFRAADSLHNRVRALEETSAGLLLLEQELELDGPPLPILMERLSTRAAGPARALFQQCRDGLERLDEENFSHLWRRLVSSCRELGEEARDCLAPLGDTLGRCGCEAQVRAVRAVRERLLEFSARAEERDRRERRVYQLLGLSGGAFLVILLL